MSSTNAGLKIPEGKVVLVTTDDWFYGSDGQMYKGVTGVPKVVKPEDLIGFHPKGSTDWMLKFSGSVHDVYIAGCKIHYMAVMRDDRPVPKDCLDMRPWKPTKP